MTRNCGGELRLNCSPASPWISSSRRLASSVSPTPMLRSASMSTATPATSILASTRTSGRSTSSQSCRPFTSSSSRSSESASSRIARGDVKREAELARRDRLLAKGNVATCCDLLEALLTSGRIDEVREHHGIECKSRDIDPDRQKRSHQLLHPMSDDASTRCIHSDERRQRRVHLGLFQQRALEVADEPATDDCESLDLAPARQGGPLRLDRDACERPI